MSINVSTEFIEVNLQGREVEVSANDRQSLDSFTLDFVCGERSDGATGHIVSFTGTYDQLEEMFTEALNNLEA